MQAFKTLLIVAVLSAVSYGVYAALTGTRDVEPPPGVANDNWEGAPAIELPSFDPNQMGAPTNLAAPAATTPPPQVVQPQPATEAPPLAPPSAQNDTGAAPPFVAPNVGPGDVNATIANPNPAAVPLAVPSAPADAPLAPPQDPAAALQPPVDVPPVVDAGMSAPPPADAIAPVATGMPESNFSTDYAAAQTLLQENRLDPALLLLSRWYGDPRLTDQEYQTLMPLLNQLAGTVIYSREHLLLPAYDVQPGDTLDRVAEHYKVPWQLLAKINGVPDPSHLRPGDKLKVVQGPFDATISMQGRLLTMTLGGRFAGSFPIGVAAEQAAPEGEYVVKNKTPNPTYYGPDRVIDANDPNNPLGKYWIGLTDQLGIHGTHDPATMNQADSRGCIRMHPRDIEDVYDMMTSESRVRILR